jgi:outer membrane protein assembly factor BamB
MKLILKTICLMILGVILLGLPGVFAQSEEAKPQWKVASKFPDKKLPGNNHLFISSDGESVALTNSKGFQSFKASEGTKLLEMDRKSLIESSLSLAVNHRMESVLDDKITYYYIPHLHSVLEFYYATAFKERITMLDLNVGKAIWEINDLNWSWERYAKAVRLASGLSKSIGVNVAANEASDFFLPEKLIYEVVKIIPDKNLMLLKTIRELVCIDLSSGAIKWSVPEISGGIATMLLDEPSNSVLLVNKESAFVVPGFQFIKKLYRINIADGSVLWESDYHNSVREKTDGELVWDDKEFDIRLVNDKIILNFLDVEVIDFNTGAKLWRTQTKNDKLQDVVGLQSQFSNYFAFPVIDKNWIYRVTSTNVGFSGMDVVLECYDLNTGTQKWVSDKLSRNEIINSIHIHGNQIIVSSKDAIISLDTENGKEKWKIDGGKASVGYKLIAHEGHLWGILGRELFKINPNDGSVVKKINLREFQKSIYRTLLLNQTLYILGGNGIVSCNLDTDEVKVASFNKKKNLGVPARYLSLMNGIIVAAPNPQDEKGYIHFIHPSLSKVKSITPGPWLRWKISSDGSVFILDKGSVTKYSW